MGIQVPELSKLTCAFLAALSSCVVIGSSIGLLRQLGGCCLLFASGDWVQRPIAAATGSDTTATQTVLALRCGSSCNCNFNIVCGCFSIASAAYYIAVISKNIIRQQEESWLHSFISVVQLSILLISICCGIIIAQLGLQAYCTLITAHHPEASCAETEYSSAIHKNYANASSIDVNDAEWKVFGGAHISAVVTIACQWVTLVAWLVYAGTCCAQLASSSKHEGFFATLRREKERVWKRMMRTRFYSKFRPDDSNEPCAFTESDHSVHPAVDALDCINDVPKRV